MLSLSLPPSLSLPLPLPLPNSLTPSRCRSTLPIFGASRPPPARGPTSSPPGPCRQLEIGRAWRVHRTGSCTSLGGPTSQVNMYAIALSSGRAEILRGWCLKGNPYTKRAEETEDADSECTSNFACTLSFVQGRSCATQCARRSTDQKAWKWIYGSRFESILSTCSICLIAPVMFLELQHKHCELVNEIERVHLESNSHVKERCVISGIKRKRAGYIRVCISRSLTLQIRRPLPRPAVLLFPSHITVGRPARRLPGPAFGARQPRPRRRT